MRERAALFGLEAARRILSAPEPPRVIMLTTYDTDENLDRALHTGVSGFLLKVSPPEHLFAAIRSAARGEVLLDPPSRAGSSTRPGRPVRLRVGPRPPR
ncbi:hypothetical protein B1L11_20370 [Microbispora sp. GKU 823]|nr:hypothetical protein B1L11_20370 [Microbispora sp. GKU 823]